MLQETIDFVFYRVLALNPASGIAQFLNFFVYDSIKIILLLFVMISLIGYLRTYVSPTKIQNFMAKGKYGAGNLAAAVFGAVTPFCSCSSIPLFFGFLRAGVPLGVTFSFLITSPLVNEYLVVLMLGFFGLKITALYVASGILIGVVCGIILGGMGLEKYLEKDFRCNNQEIRERKFKTQKGRIRFGIRESVAITKRLWLWILVSVFIGALIHNYVPQEAIQGAVEGTGILNVPIAVLIGVPLYGSCVAIVPIAVALFEKGVPLGTALAFMMAVSALSLPEAVLLKQAMKTKLILIFFTIVTLGIILTGYAFNLIQAALV